MFYRRGVFCPGSAVLAHTAKTPLAPLRAGPAAPRRHSNGLRHGACRAERKRKGKTLLGQPMSARESGGDAQ